MPFFHIGSLSNAHWPTGIDQRPSNIVIPSSKHHFLVLLGCTSFYTCDKSRPDPDPRSTVPKVCLSKAEQLSQQRMKLYASAAAKPRPSAIPPAATTMTGSPVRGLLASLQRSTTLGIRMEKGMSPVCPPPSPP